MDRPEFIPLGSSMVPVADVIRWGWTDFSRQTSSSGFYESARIGVWLRSSPLVPVVSEPIQIYDGCTRVDEINAAMARLFPGVVGDTNPLGFGIGDILELAKC